MTAANLVYILCAATSLTAALLLARGYARSRVRLLLWSSLCFTGLFLNNLLLMFERLFVPTMDLLNIRQVPALVGISLLLYGLIFEVERR